MSIITRSLCVALALAAAPAYSYEMRQGLVRRVSVNSPVFSNRSVIVEISGVSQLCSTIASEQGYFNKADLPDTFAAFVSTLLTAQASGRPVTVFVTPGIEGCRIDQVQLTE